MIVSRFGQGQNENGEPRLSLAPLVFSGILRLDARGDCRLLMSTAFLSGIDGFDVDKMTVKCGGGTTISQLCRYLHAAGAALPNVPSLPHVTVAGLCSLHTRDHLPLLILFSVGCMSTATHGSGNQFPVISAMAASLELVSADGTLHKFERGTEEFRAAAVCNLVPATTHKKMINFCYDAGWTRTSRRCDICRVRYCACLRHPSADVRCFASFSC